MGVLNVLQPNRIERGTLALYFGTFLSYLTLIRLPSRLLRTTTIIMTTRALGISFGIRNVRLMRTNRFPRSLPRSNVLPLLARTLRLAKGALNGIIRRRVLCTTRRRVLILCGGRHLFRSLARFANLIYNRNNGIPILMNLRIDIRSNGMNFLLQNILFRPLFNVLSLTPRLLRLGFPNLIRVIQPITSLLQRPALLPFRNNAISRLRLPIGTPTRTFRDLPCIPPF